MSIFVRPGEFCSDCAISESTVQEAEFVAKTVRQRYSFALKCAESLVARKGDGLKPSSSIFDLPCVRVPKIITSLLHPTQETNFGMEFGEKTLNASIIIPLVTIVVNSLNHNCLLDMNYNPSRGCPTMNSSNIFCGGWHFMWGRGELLQLILIMSNS